MKVEGIIVVTADWEKAGQYALKVCEAVSKAQNIPVEIKKEDYDFLITHGEKDEFGGVDMPQIFLKLEGGAVKHVMTRIPDKSNGMPDIEMGIKKLTEAIASQ
uniref:Thioredoxin family protein n=1 Tax=Candidatus Methanomethylicus mesodigestus TaxID=1867258 RepID=A0A7C3ISD5_9CREN